MRWLFRGGAARSPEWRWVDGNLEWRCPHSDWVRVPLGEGEWRVLKYAPLSLYPSIHRWACGCHGWVTNGEWWPVGRQPS